ncbi:MAG: GGDEF domain-containing protein [Gammaproteobacteria bacterium]|nr:GGDEF domain-containing protein [Gammaproteobacteria bacterium]
MTNPDSQATLHPLLPQFVDRDAEQAFQEANLRETRNGLALLASAAFIVSCGTLLAAWFHLPHEQPGFLPGQLLRGLLLLAAAAAFVVVLKASKPATLHTAASTLLALGCMTLMLRMTIPPPEGADPLVALLHVTRDGTTILLVVAIAVLTLLAGHFLIHATIFALTLVGTIVIAHTWPDGAPNAAGFSYAFGSGFMFVLALGNGIQRMRRNIYVSRLELQRANAQLHELAIRDHLTRSLNRRHFYDVAEAELQRAQRYHAPMSLLLLDLDDFKGINDRHGHACGDAALCQLVDLIQGRLRNSDILARIGGEEFVVLLPETEPESARQLAERLRQAIADQPFEHGEIRVTLTASWGVATAHTEDRDIDSLLDRADRALYAAKDSGRNRVCVATSEVATATAPIAPGSAG